MISRNTVVAAYEVLVGEGYLVNQARSGFRVNQATQAFRAIPVRRRATQEKRLEPRVPIAPVPFRPTQPDVSLFPLQIWNRHRNRVLKRGASLLHYQSRFSIGLDKLRRNVADYLRDSRGVRCQWNEVAITNGSQQALFLLAHLMLRPSEPVYMEDPGYSGASKAWRNAGATIVPAPIDAEGITLPVGQPLHAKLIYVTPSHQFPLGVCMSLARRLALLKAAREAGAWIVEDDYDAEFRYTSTPQPSLQSLDDQRRVIYMGSFSKTLFPGLRIGYVVLPPSLVEGFTALKSIADDYSPLIDQATLASKALRRASAVFSRSGATTRPSVDVSCDWPRDESRRTLTGRCRRPQCKPAASAGRPRRSGLIALPCCIGPAWIALWTCRVQHGGDRPRRQYDASGTFLVFRTRAARRSARRTGFPRLSPVRRSRRARRRGCRAA